MSDPVTNAEIEDVLSSIRRLVSDDGRGDPAAQPGSNAQPAPAKPANRLVLTPALRVPDKDGGQPQAVEPASPAPELASAPETQAAAEQPLPPLTLNVSALAPQAGQDAAAADDAPAEDEPAAAAPTEAVEAAETEAVDLPLPEDTAAPATAGVQADPAEPGQSDAPWREPGATLFGAAAVSAPGIGAPAAEDASADAEDAGSPAAAQHSPKVSAVVQKIAELEAKVGQSQEQWEPDGKSNDPYSGTNVETLQWEDHTEEDDTPSSGSAGLDTDLGAEEIVAEAAADEALDALGEEESYLDEETLRELVAEIVREELQGALGERITRNVRKLVRREIHRALAAQDLL